jgi:hypothetical protein
MAALWRGGNGGATTPDLGRRLIQRRHCEERGSATKQSRAAADFFWIASLRSQ